MSCADGAAQAAGITPGLTLADARALAPSLHAVEADPEGDLATLDKMADWALRWTPWTAVDGLEPGGSAALWLDVTGCTHLFGGEEALLEDIILRLDHLGFASRPGMGDGKGAAWAAARFLDPGRPYGLIPEGAARQIMPSLPIEALRLDPATADTLRRLGLRTLADLLALPRAPLAARFGRETALRLDQAMGRIAEPFSPRRPPVEDRVRLALAEPIGLLDDVRAALAHLLSELCAHLARTGRGARHLILDLFRVDGTVVRREVGTALPTRDPARLIPLFRDRLDDIDSGFGIELLTLSAPLCAPLPRSQESLPDDLREDSQHPEKEKELSILFDRLDSRSSRRSVVRQVPRQSHVPEHSTQFIHPFEQTGASSWPPAIRPPHLIAAPEQVTVLDGGMTGPPTRMRWRRHSLRFVRWEGPERISAEWWHGATPPTARAVRDYWRVEDDQGRRLWLFRNGNGWFVHGTLP